MAPWRMKVIKKTISKLVLAAALAGMVLAVLAWTADSAPAMAASRPAAGVHALPDVPNPCPGNTFQYKANQPTYKWGVAWASRPTKCSIQAALLCHPNNGGRDRWRWGRWKQDPGIWSKVGSCFAGYSACKGNVNVSKSAATSGYYYITAYLWSICKNAKTPPEPGGIHLTAQHTGTATAPAIDCSRPYRWRDGYVTVEGETYPFAAGEWTGDPSGCGTLMQTRVRFSHGCPNAPLSGVVKRNWLWDSSAGFSNSNFCSGWIRFRCPESSCIWSGWHRMGSSDKTASLTAFQGGWPGRPHGQVSAWIDRAGCRGGILGQIDPGGRWRWGTWWTTNPNSPPCWQRSSMQCENTLNGDKAWYHGGWVKRVDLLSGDTCPLLAKVVQAGVDYGHYAGKPYTYTKLWPAG